MKPKSISQLDSVYSKIYFGNLYTLSTFLSISRNLVVSQSPPRRVASCSFVAIVFSVSEQLRHETLRNSTEPLKSVTGEQATEVRSYLGAITASFSALLQEQAGFFARVITFEVR